MGKLFALTALVASVLGSPFGHEQTCKAGMTAHYYEGLNCESEVSSKVFTEEDVEKYTSCVEVEKVLWFDPPGTDKNIFLLFAPAKESLLSCTEATYAPEILLTMTDSLLGTFATMITAGPPIAPRPP